MWRGCVVYLYAGARLSNWNGRVKCEMFGSEQTRKGLMEASQQEGSSSLNQDLAGCIREMLQEDGHSSIHIDLWLCNYAHKNNCCEF